MREFSGGLVVRTPGFHCCDLNSIPGQKKKDGNFFKKLYSWDLPGGPVVETPHIQCKGLQV